ncbi:MAG TPA: amidase family protein [Vicinamibacteria bacterium]|nr:amidase family protein [Vicinamibacteria bacterium]
MIRFLIAAALLPQAEVDFDVFEKTIPELQDAMESGRVTSVEITRQYLERIEAFDRKPPALNAMIHLNPNAIEQAEALDRERAERGSRGPLHGIPVILKDNYDTFDMPTTVSSASLAGFVPPDDGFQVWKLREAGAVFIGKSNMHEFARGITTISSLGGQTLNPYDPIRNPGGSSGGTGAAIAASFAAVGMGSDTCGSIRIPAANGNLFGLRVTQGLSSRDGIIPLSHTQDVGGPIARSVIDLALVLDATVGPDEADPQTASGGARRPPSYTTFLREGALDGVRLGILRSMFDEKEVTDVVLEAVEVMKAEGAEAVDVEVPDLSQLLESSGVIDMEFKQDFEAYLRASGAPVQTLAEILGRGLYHDALESPLRRSVEKDPDPDEYGVTLAKRDVLRDALLKVIADNRLDAIVYPTLRRRLAVVGDPQSGSACQVAAHSGLPAFSLPAGLTEDGVPVGIELLGKPFSEPDLIAMAFDYERAARPRVPPQRTPSLKSGPLSRAFTLEASQNGITAHATFLLDHPSQTLDNRIDLEGVLPGDVTSIRLHRGENGPIVARLEDGPRGSLLVRNRDLGALLAGEWYLAVATTAHPLGALVAPIQPK